MTQDQVFSLATKHAQAPAIKYKVNSLELANVLVAIAWVESKYNPQAKNKESTARGLMQMLICTQRENEYKRLKISPAPAMYKCSHYLNAPIGSRDNDKMFDPDYSMKLAAYELAYQYDRYRDKYNDPWRIAAHAYNQGSYPGKWKKDGINYANKVMELSPLINSGINSFPFMFFLNTNRIEFY